MAEQTSSSPGLGLSRRLQPLQSARAVSHMPTNKPAPAAASIAPTPSTCPPPETPRRRRRRFLLRSRARARDSQATYATSTAFRRALVNATPSKRAVRLHTGRVVELTPMPMGGNCGFVAVSWALLIAGRLPGNDVSGRWVRAALAAHVAAQAGFYAEKVDESRVVSGGKGEAEESVQAFVRGVREDGLKGHWLGQMWGFLEIFAVARAFSLNVELYAFDVGSQKVRLYHQQNEGKHCVALLFSGQAEGGHFDLLLPMTRFGEGWRGRRRG